MKAVFCHDHVFTFDDAGAAYSPGQFPYAIWQRYLGAFEQLVVVGRGRKARYGGTGGLTLSSGPRVGFECIPQVDGALRRLWRRREAKRILAENIARADAVIARLPSDVGLLAHAIARAQDKPLAVEVVACAFDAYWNYGTLQGKVYAPVQEWLTRRALRSSPFALYVTRAFLQRRYPTSGRTAVASNVELPPLEPAILARRLQRLEVPKAPLVFGFVGSIGHRYKGLQTALAALARVRERLPAFELRVLGPGDSKPWRAAAAQLGLGDRVRFCGTLPGGQPVLDWLSRIDLYLHPSFQDGLPRSLVEAMSQACPALGSTAGGTPELLPAECLHRPGDAQRLAALIVHAATDPNWQRRQAERNFATARHYSRDVLEPRRSAFWQEFAAHVRARRGRPQSAPARFAPEPGRS